MRKYMDCGHPYDGPTDSGYCQSCEAAMREAQEQEAILELGEVGDERDPEDEEEETW